MSLDHAILGFLQYKPLSGYDLKAAFDSSVQHFWPADQSQIYRTLSRLEENGWTTTEVVEQDVRPDRKVYHITDQGRDELMHWLTTPLPTKSKRITELIQVFFAGHLTDEEVIALFRRLADHSRQALDYLRALPRENKGERPKEASSRDVFFWELTLDYGIHMSQASLQWMEDVITRIERGDHLKGEVQ